MTNYWVSTTGDNGDPGTEAAPWATLPYAVTQVSGGDTVTFKDGTYSCGDGADTIDCTGSAGNVITFRAETEHGAILNYSSSSDIKWYVSYASYVTFEDLVLDGGDGSSGSELVRVRYSDHITFDNCIIRDSQGDCIRFYGGSQSYMTVQDCTLSMGNFNNAGQNTLTFYNVSNVTVDNCDISQSDHVGIGCSFVTDSVISNNDVHDNYTHCISVLDDCDNLTIRNNILRDTGYDASTSGCGIFMDRSGQGTITIRNNEFRGLEQAGVYISEDPDGPIYIHYNTFYDNCNDDSTYGHIRAYTASAATNPTVEIVNNIFYTTDGEYVYQIRPGQPDSNWWVDYNCYYAAGNQRAAWKGTTYTDFTTLIASSDTDDSDSIDQDNPDFTNAGAGDFTLQAVSPCIGAGTDEGYGTDMGAYPYEASPGTVEPDPVTAVGGVGIPTTVVGGSEVVEPIAVSSGGSAVDPTLVLGAITVPPSAVSGVGAVVAPTVVLGSLAIAPSEATAVGAAVAPSVVLGSLALTPGVVTAVGVVVAPTVVLGSLTVTPSEVSAVGAAVAPTVVLGSLALTPSVVTVVGAVVAPTVVLGSVAITPAVVTVVAAVVAPTVILGSLEVTPSEATAVGGRSAPVVTMRTLWGVIGYVVQTESVTGYVG